MNYCLFNGAPAIVEESTDGQRMVRLACQMTEIPMDELTAKYRKAKRYGYLSFAEYVLLFGREYRAVLLPYESLYLSGIVTEMPADYWHKNIPKTWWSYPRLPTGFPSKEILA